MTGACLVVHAPRKKSPIRMMVFCLPKHIQHGYYIKPMATKITFDTVRKIGLRLPGVEESTTYGVTSLKVDGKLLTCPAINKSAEPNSIVIRLDFDRRDDLLAEAPDTYY